MMDRQMIIDYCSDLQGVTQEVPFDDKTLVFKVKGKMFALMNMAEPFRLNLKCDPVKGQLLRQEFENVQPGYHMNKKHWLSVYLPAALSDQQLLDLINESYNLVVCSLPKKVQRELQGG